MSKNPSTPVKFNIEYRWAVYYGNGKLEIVSNREFDDLRRDWGEGWIIVKVKVVPITENDIV